MTTLINDLNYLLERTRAVFEAARIVADQVEESDPDIEAWLQDVSDEERWSSSGLYHRITQLDGTPGLIVTEFVSRVEDEDNLQGKIRLLCREHKSIARQAKTLASRDDIDKPTRELLLEMHGLHQRNTDLCCQILAE